MTTHFCSSTKSTQRDRWRTWRGATGLVLLACAAAPAQAVQTVSRSDTSTTNGVTYTYYTNYNTNNSIGGGTYSYPGSTIFNWSSDPGSTYLLGLDYYVSGQVNNTPTTNETFDHADGVLVYSSWFTGTGPAAVTVPSGGTVQSIFSGNGWGYGVGIETKQYYGDSTKPNVTINNSGTVDGEVTNNDGVGAGVSGWSLYGGITATNNAGGTFSGEASWYATGITANAWYGDVDVTNYGKITGTASGGTQGPWAGVGKATGTDLFSYQANVNFTNAGTCSSSAAGSTNASWGAFLWAQGTSSGGGSMTLKNTGTITASGQRAMAVYCGGNYGTQTVTNSGTISGTGGSGGGWGLAVEDDVNDAINITNSGSISHNNGLGVAVMIGSGTATINNSGSIYGGLTGISAQTFAGPVVVNDSGDVGCGNSGNGAMVFGSGNITVNVSGLPTITGSIVGGGGNNNLTLNLSGALQQVNGAPATKGNNLANYGLGISGSIVVSGKTYSWQNFHVSGTITGYTTGLGGWHALAPENATGSRLDVNNWGGNGAKVQIWQTTGYNNQAFWFADQGNGVYEIQPMYNTGLCLDVTGQGTSPGTSVQVWSCWGGSNQQWGAISDGGGDYEFAPQNNPNLRMDVWGASSANGTQVDVWTANGGSNQKWYLY